MKTKPWGFYITLLNAKYFKVKVLYFKRGGEISTQKHAWREEVWLWIFGQGTFKNSFNPPTTWAVSDTKRGDYKKVSRTEWHHYKAKTPTLVLEIQTGVCQEDDIFKMVGP